MDTLRRRCLFIAAAVVGCTLPLLGHAAPPAPSGLVVAPVAGGLVRVKEGRELLRDCRPWVPLGMSFFGRVIPANWTSNRSTMAARNEYGPWTIDAVKWAGGDVIRIQVGMPFVDPVSPQYAANYLADIRAAVAQARGQGLTVIVSLQYAGRTGVPPVEMQPKESARRSWQVLGPVFAADLGVVYELFNEPASSPRPDAGRWEAWRKGHQTIIDDLRKAGIRNTLIVDGMNGARTFQGAPALNDPTRQLIYAVHPYLREGYASPAEWDAAFGDFAKTHPVLVTEWGHSQRNCEVGGEAIGIRLLDYLEKRRIGVIAYGADEISSSMLKRNGRSFSWTSFKGRSCGQPGAGPGELVQGAFKRASEMNAAAAQVPAEVCGLR